MHLMLIKGDSDADPATDLVYIARQLLGLNRVPASLGMLDLTIPMANGARERHVVRAAQPGHRRRRGPALSDSRLRSRFGTTNT